uniref:Uncharacterized protein n=1 Tax=Anguilla anguilla TaxID=7936 RepID=A0A0E9XCB0_ANGAN
MICWSFSLPAALVFTIHCTFRLLRFLLGKPVFVALTGSHQKTIMIPVKIHIVIPRKTNVLRCPLLSAVKRRYIFTINELPLVSAGLERLVFGKIKIVLGGHLLFHLSQMSI